MELQNFIQKAIIETVTATEEASKILNREIKIAIPQDSQSMIFDVAVTTENTNGATASIKIFEALTASLGDESKNLSVSRIKFGVYISSLNKEEQRNLRQTIEQTRPF